MAACAAALLQLLQGAPLPLPTRKRANAHAASRGAVGQMHRLLRQNCLLTRIGERSRRRLPCEGIRALMTSPAIP
jgi:hypothetical protein